MLSWQALWLLFHLFQAGGLFNNKPAFGTQTTASTGFGGFGTGANTGSNLFAKPFSTPSTGFGGFNATATQSTGFGCKFELLNCMG